MKKRQRFMTYALIGLLGISLLASGCGQKAEEKVNTGIQGAAEVKPIKLGHFGATCEAPLFIAYEKGFFKKEGINVELVKGDYETNKEGLATGKIDATDGVLNQWLKPTEQGLDLKFTTGIHTGCASLITTAGSAINNISGLKGKTIGVSGGIGGGPMNYAFRLALQAGLKPQTDITWKNFPAPQLETALAKGEIDAAVAGDNLAMTWVKQGKAKVINSMAKDEPLSKEICCLLGFNGEFLQKDQASAIKLTNAVIKAAKWVQQNPDEAAKILVDKKYTLGTKETNAEILRDFKYDAGVPQGKAALRNAIIEFKETGIFGPNTDPDQLVQKIFVELPGVEK